MDFIGRLAALVPIPRVNLTRFHWAFAPNSEYRAGDPDQAGQGWSARLRRLELRPPAWSAKTMSVQ
jgi:hypothetical protein